MVPVISDNFLIVENNTSFYRMYQKFFRCNYRVKGGKGSSWILQERLEAGVHLTVKLSALRVLRMTIRSDSDSDNRSERGIHLRGTTCGANRDTFPLKWIRTFAWYLCNATTPINRCKLGKIISSI